MPRSRLFVVALASSLAAPTPARAEQPLGTVAGSKVAFEGLLQVDAVRWHDDVANLRGGTPDSPEYAVRVRRAELVLKGKGPGKLEWVAGYDTRSQRWLDVNLKHPLGPGVLQLGQFKQPIGLEELTSTRQNDFISKSMLTQSWAGGRRLGGAYQLSGKRMGASVSGFTRELTRDQAVGKGVAARVYATPILGDAGTLHLGLAMSDQQARQGRALAHSARFRARPGNDHSIRLIDTGSIAAADRLRTTALEALWLHGPLKLQGEAMRARVSRDAAQASVHADGAYASALWNLGGASWQYKSGLPSPPSAKAGADLWQLGLRVDHMDLDDHDAGIRGGRMTTWTAGVNWYHGAHLKLSLNLVRADSARFLGTTGRNYSRDPAWNDANLQRVVEDDPGVVQLRAQWAL